MAKQIELEIELRQCSHMKLKTENIKKPFNIDLGEGNHKSNIGDIIFHSEKVICEHTEKPCVLYTGDYRNTYWPHLDYSRLNRCPSIAKGYSKEVVIKYRLKGKKSGSRYLRVSDIEKIEARAKGALP